MRIWPLMFGTSSLLSPLLVGSVLALLAAESPGAVERPNIVLIISEDNGPQLGCYGDPSAAWEYGLGWAHVSCTPFRHYKRNMFNGGAATPFIACWPARLKPRWVITDQQAHIIDLMATSVDVAGWPWPSEFDGKPLAVLPGKSLRPIFAGDVRAPHDTLYFHLMDHRALIQGNWKLASDWNRPWQLFNLDTDRTELYDLSTTEPERFKNLAAHWTNWWSGKNAGLFKFAGNEPTYRRLDDQAGGSQGGNEERGQTRPARRKNKQR